MRSADLNFFCYRVHFNPPQGLFLYAGKWDIMRPSTGRIHHRMKHKGYSHEYSKYPGGHAWHKGWIEEYQDLLKKVFKE